MWQMVAVELGIMGLDFVYNYLNQPPRPEPQREVQVPITTEGAPYPIIYGRGRVRAPVLAYTGDPIPFFVDKGNGGGNYPDNIPHYYYTLDMFFVLGIPFQDGGGTNHIHAMWVGDVQLPEYGYDPAGTFTTCHLDELVGDGHFEGNPLTGSPPGSNRRVLLSTRSPDGGDSGFNTLIEGGIEFFNGNRGQQLVHYTGAFWTADSYAGEYMCETSNAFPGEPQMNLNGSLAFEQLPGYRGLMSVFLYNAIGRSVHWLVGDSPNVNAYSFGVMSHCSDPTYPSVGLYQKIGLDANPCDVIYDILVGKFGKLGLDIPLLDDTSFRAAAKTLYDEGHGYSRVFEQGSPAQEMLRSILAQIDATLYEEPTTGKLGIKLIRNDYDPATIPVIDKSNCYELKNLAIGGWTGLPNKIRVTFTDQQNHYNQNSATAQNLASAVGQDGLVREQVVEMPGISNGTLALAVAERILASQSKPLIKCTAIVDGSFWRVKPGDVVKVSWTKPGISGLVFRVANVNRGTLADGRIALTLFQDAFYTWRNRPPIDTGFGGHAVDGGGLISGG